MKYATLLAGLAVLSVVGAAEFPRPITLDEVGGLVTARRAFTRMTEDERLKLVIEKKTEDGTIELRIQDRHLLVCVAGFASLYEKEVLVSKAVEHLRLTIQPINLANEEAKSVVEKALDELGVRLIPAGESILVLGAKQK